MDTALSITKSMFLSFFILDEAVTEVFILGKLTEFIGTIMSIGVVADCCLYDGFQNVYVFQYSYETVHFSG